MKRAWALAALLVVASGCTPAPPLVHALPDSPDCRRHTGLPKIVLDRGPSRRTPEAAADGLVKALGRGHRTEDWKRRSESGDTIELAAAPYIVQVFRSNDGGWLGSSLRECLKAWG